MPRGIAALLESVTRIAFVALFSCFGFGGWGQGLWFGVRLIDLCITQL